MKTKTPETDGAIRERLALIEERLGARYPDATCALAYEGDPWKLLVMARLSAQCTDARVNLVARELFAAFPDALSLGGAAPEEVERLIRPCGLFRQKAQDVIGASRMLCERFAGRVPDTMEELLTLPGVGRKIANLLLGDVYGKEAVVADTHCMRLAGRFGAVEEGCRDPRRVEDRLRALIDPKTGSDFCHRLVLFGREICKARAPLCDDCPLSDLCAHAREARHG